MKPLIFEQLTPIEVPVQLAGDSYLLREASGEAAAKFNNARTACYDYMAGKLSKIHDTGDLEPLLVALCIFTHDGKPVPESTVRGWPARIVTALFEKAKEISGLGPETVDDLLKQRAELDQQIARLQEQEDPRKNLLTGTMVG